MMRWIWLFAGLLIMTGIAASEEDMHMKEDMSSAQLVQFAVDKMGNSGQNAEVFGFDYANSSQIGYSSNGNVTQVVSYDNIGNGSILQWGESGDMTREERTLSLNKTGDSGFIWQWNRGDVNQTINVTNSGNLYLRQIIGGLRKILFPDPKENDQGNWWFCGKAVNDTGGLPLCAEKMAKSIFKGKATVRDLYMLQVLEEDYDVFPSENLTPHVVMTRWNITKADGNLTIKFRAYNFGKRAYNATLLMDMASKMNIINLNAKDYNTDGMPSWEIKMPETKVVEVGNYSVPSLKEIEEIVVVPLNDLQLNNLKMKMISQ